MTAGEHGHLAVAVHTHDGALPAAVQAAALGEIGARSGARLVDERRETYSHQNALRAQARLLAPQRAIVRDLDEAVEQRRGIAGIVDAPAGGGIRELGARYEIAPAQLHHVDAELAGAALEQPLVGPGRLRPPRAAIGIDRHGVGIDAAHPQVEVRWAV